MIFPFIDGEVENTEIKSTLDTPKEYAWDFTINNFILKNGKFIIVEGLEAIKIWVYKALQTERFKYLAYSFNYGNEFNSLVGTSNISTKALQSEAKRIVEETLSVNPYINSIEGFTAIVVEDTIKIEFTVISDYGEVNISV